MAKRLCRHTTSDMDMCVCVPLLSVFYECLVIFITYTYTCLYTMTKNCSASFGSRVDYSILEIDKTLFAGRMACTRAPLRLVRRSKSECSEVACELVEKYKVNKSRGPPVPLSCNSDSSPLTISELLGGVNEKNPRKFVLMMTPTPARLDPARGLNAR